MQYMQELFLLCKGSNIYSLETSNTFRFLYDLKLNFASRPWKWKNDSDCSLYSDAYGTESRRYKINFEGAFLIDWNQFRWNLKHEGKGSWSLLQKLYQRHLLIWFELRNKWCNYKQESGNPAVAPTDVYLHRKVSHQSNYLKTWRSRAFRRKSSESNRTEVLQETYVAGQAFTGSFFNLLTNQTTGCQLVVSQW